MSTASPVSQTMMVTLMTPSDEGLVEPADLLGGPAATESAQVQASATAPEGDPALRPQARGTC